MRKIAREHHIDVRNIAGSGEGGRVTKNDILAYIDAGAPASARSATLQARARSSAPLLAPNPSATAGLDPAKYERTPMSVMRRKIAEHMVMSKRTSPHVHSAFEIDFTKVDEIRKAKKAEYEKAGGKLTYMSFITKACAEALKKVPIVNASVDGADIIYKKDINIGVAVALDWGLIVPVVKNADGMSLLDISKAIADLAARAREKKLKPEDVQGGTFTITNPGVFGALFGMPIISQPQVAIVGVGAVEKRPVVIDDAVTIRLRAYMTIGYDHRVIDGAIADEFMQVVKKMIENWDRCGGVGLRGVRGSRAGLTREEIQNRRLRSLFDDVESCGFEHRSPSIWIRSRVMPERVRRRESRPRVDVHDRQQKLATRFQYARRFAERLGDVGARNVIDCRHADCAIVRAGLERQLTSITDLHFDPVRHAGNARVRHQPLRRVAVDSEVAPVDVDRGHRDTRFRKQQPNRCAARAGADVDDATRSGCEEAVGSGRDRQVDAKQRVRNQQARDAPGRDERRGTDHPPAPLQPDAGNGEPAEQRERHEMSPADRPAVPEVVGERRCHAATIAAPALNAR